MKSNKIMSSLLILSVIGTSCLTFGTSASAKTVKTKTSTINTFTSNTVTSTGVIKVDKLGNCAWEPGYNVSYYTIKVTNFSNQLITKFNTNTNSARLDSQVIGNYSADFIPTSFKIEVYGYNSTGTCVLSGIDYFSFYKPQNQFLQ